MSRYLGNKHTKEVHDTLNEKTQCQLEKIKDDHKEDFATLSYAYSRGYDNCAHCIGNSKR